ncbi:aromatic ring-hydroxylating dioxygenase subunit alpha [Actinomadura sp. KC345]|uniref:aromatic ring-hydroxylating oxygenase subunit alpha n=1 Tax=Actinomadura sp. KC345 TaxID=2530371 RepID=UPI00104A19A7|nr:aromatic ring-hydroxylating dioxygenase subunit alpha [Actinomadura sp. KC345]TDC55483.1 aromatic ring-hydroxylating dioxygenase subunit alpha [Actinomadura sp. KC345]
MSLTDDLKQIHANAEKHRLEYPPEAEFGELHRPDPEHSYIDPKRYTSPEFLQREFDSLWSDIWQMACRAEQVAEPGDYHEYTIGRQSYLVVHGQDGRLRAFHNVCPHRGKILKPSCGSAKELRCGYHAWAWTLDGRLKDIPDRSVFPEIKDDDYALHEVACDQWGGFVFIHPVPAEAGSLRDFLEPLAGEVDKYHLDRFRASMHAEIVLDCNWKTALEAFLEAYHVKGTHPQIMTFLDDVNTKFSAYGRHAMMIVPYGVPSMRLEHVDPAEVYESYYSRSASGFRHSKQGKGEQATGMPAQHSVELPPELFDEDGEWKLAEPVREYLIKTNRAKESQFGHDYSELSDAQMVDDYDYHVFPNLKFNAHAGGALTFRSRPHPTNPDLCVFDVYTLVWDNENEAPLDVAPTISVDIKEVSMGQVLDQDFSNLPEVQRGLHNAGLKHLTVGGSEMRVIHFHKNLMEQLEQRRAH